MFGMGFGEILLVLVIALVFLGPEKIPETARTLGKWAHELKRSMDDLKGAFEKDAKPPAQNSIAKLKESISKDPPPPNQTP